MMTNRFVVLIGLALAVSASSADAQRSRRSGMPIELGVDGGVTFGLDQPRTTEVSLPVQSFRVGFLVTDNLELEPRFNLNSVHVRGGGSFTTYAFEIGALFQPSGDRVGRGLYIRPFLGVAGVSVSGGGSDNSGYGGVGVGIKLPFADRRLALRMETNYSHGFSNSTDQIAVLIGLSYFTR